MIFARVTGTVVPSKSAADIPGAVWRVVELSDHHGRSLDSRLIALDALGVRDKDLVLLCRGSSVRWTEQTADKPVDALIAAQVEIVDEDGTLTFRS
ncbi:MAG: hypothetical protein B0D92_03570 [Spirochaeta sp. LUC14_002_19_P3]|nr:MAG: hypothetical protein B0D92_03570 [Spirochaeta sp. LUC14_002_19_P3]